MHDFLIARGRQLHHIKLAIMWYYIILSPSVSPLQSAVERYTGPKDDRKVTVSMHSLQKKVRRMQQAFTQMTGLRTKVCFTSNPHIRCLRVKSLQGNLYLHVKYRLSIYILLSIRFRANFLYRGNIQ